MSDINQTLENLGDGLAGLDAASDQSDSKTQKAVTEVSKNLPADAFLAARKTINNPSAVENTKEDISDKGAPESPNAILAVGLASALPMLLGSIFGGTEGGIAATEGALKGASSAVELGGKIQEINQQAEMAPIEKNIALEKLRALKNQEAGNPLEKQIMLDVDTGRPVMRTEKGFVNFAGKVIDPDKVVPKSVFDQIKIGERSKASADVNKSKLDISERSLQLREKKTGIQEQQFERSMTERQSAETRSVVKNINTDSVVKKSNEMSASADNILKLVDMSATNPIAAAAIPTFMARASGEVGNLSEADKMPFGGSRAMLARIDQIKQQFSSGTLTPENQKYVRELAAAFKRSAQSNRDKRIDNLAGQYSGKDLTKEEIKAKFESGSIPDVSQMTPKQRLEYLRSKRGVK